ncbi:MAG TPA: HAD family hydrolase, partial [Solirubrobacteraceae bacterium]|nr:HAD family hydrolase [Solirubrobacteraceae bacterium]
MAQAAILDVDGTLVDTNYQHALAWYRAFRQHGFVLPIWKIHRAIGMGGDQLVPHMIGEEKAEEVGEDVRGAEKPLFKAMIEECEPLEGARDLIKDLRDREKVVILASSAKGDEIEHYLDLLDARELANDGTMSDDVEQTKPAPDLVQAAIEQAGTDDAIMVGDTTWDIEAAKRAGIQTIAVMTGGFSADELEEAGAAQV